MSRRRRFPALRWRRAPRYPGAPRIGFWERLRLRLRRWWFGRPLVAHLDFRGWPDDQLPAGALPHGLRVGDPCTVCRAERIAVGPIGARPEARMAVSCRPAKIEGAWMGPLGGWRVSVKFPDGTRAEVWRDDLFPA